MDTLYVAYRYGDTRLFARLVCLIRGGDSAHCEMAEDLGNGMFWCTSSSWMDGGVRQKYMALPKDKWRLYKTDVPVAAADEWFLRNKQYGYGWWKLIRFLFPWFRPSMGGPICTEAVAEMLGLGHTDSWDLRTLEAAVAWRYGPPINGSGE
jgi:hypothetical protein